MKLSTKIRYGSRAYICIAALSDNGPVSLSEVAKRENISQKYLELIVSLLRNNDLVEGVRGAQGGYVIKKPLPEVSMADVVTALGGAISIIDCVSNQEECESRKECALFGVWDEVNKNIISTLKSINVKDLVEKKRHLNLKKNSMYYI